MHDAGEAVGMISILMGREECDMLLNKQLEDPTQFDFLC